jgi:hypothetical protein
MATRSFSGTWVVVGVLALAIGGTYLLNVFTAGAPDELKAALSAAPTPSPVGSIEATPTSSSARRGRAYSVRITTGCGFVTAVDFDGSFWEPTDGRTLPSVGRRLTPPVDPATIALQAPDSALLRTAAGQALTLSRTTLRRVAMPVCS